MKVTRTIIGGLVALLLVQPVFAQGGKKKKDKSKVAAEKSYALYKKEAQLFYDAQKAKMLDDYAEAIRLLEQVLVINPDNDAAHYEMAELKFSGNEVQAALAHAQKAVELLPENHWYVLLYCDLLTTVGDFKTAIKSYESLIAQQPDVVDYKFDLAFTHIQNDDYQAALQVYDQVQDQIGINEMLIDQKKKLWLRLGKVDQAAAELEQLISEYPGEIRYLATLADLYEVNGEAAKAQEVYERMLAIDADDPIAMQALAKAAFNRGDIEEYMKYQRIVFADREFPIDGKVRVLYGYLQNFEQRKDEMDQAFELAEILTETHSNEAKAFAVRGDLHYLNEEDEKALGFYLQSLELNEEVFTVWQQIMTIYNVSSRYVDLEAFCNRATALYPNQGMVQLYLGIARGQLKKYDKALKAYNRALMMTGGNKALEAQLWSNMGDIYHDTEAYSQSDSCFDRALKVDPNNAYTLNNFSYYLSLRDEQLDKALSMSMRSNELVPNNPSFLDTYAWILYKKGDFAKAKEWQQKAIQNGGDNQPVVLEHYGDILFQLGEVDQAVEYWQQAMQNGSESDVLQRKISDRKLYE